jgi:hypothetical protein
VFWSAADWIGPRSCTTRFARLDAGLDPLPVAERQARARQPRAHERRVLDLLIDHPFDPHRRAEEQRLGVACAEARRTLAARFPSEPEPAPGPEQVAEVERHLADRAGLALRADHALESVVARLDHAIDELAAAAVAVGLEPFVGDAAEQPELLETTAPLLGGAVIVGESAQPTHRFLEQRRARDVETLEAHARHRHVRSEPPRETDVETQGVALPARHAEQRVGMTVIQRLIERALDRRREDPGRRPAAGVEAERRRQEGRVLG